MIKAPEETSHGLWWGITTQSLAFLITYRAAKLTWVTLVRWQMLTNNLFFRAWVCKFSFATHSSPPSSSAWFFFSNAFPRLRELLSHKEHLGQLPWQEIEEHKCCVCKTNLNSNNGSVSKAICKSMMLRMCSSFPPSQLGAFMRVVYFFQGWLFSCF